jgi:toxin ParE1/3/4
MTARKRGYRLSPRAEADLEGIWNYTVETWSAEQAEAVGNAHGLF